MSETGKCCCSIDKSELELASNFRCCSPDNTACSGNWRLAEKLFHIISDRFSRDFFERHDHMMVEFLLYFQEGFFLRDMHTLTNITATLFERYNEHFPYVQHITCILNLFGETIPRIESKSDEIEFVIATSNFISLLGYYSLSEPNFKSLLILTLLTFSEVLKKDKKRKYTTFPNGIDSSMLRPVTDAFVVTAFEDSTLCFSLIQILMRDKETDFTFVVDIIIILNNLAEMSSKNCEKILLNKGAEVTCALMNTVPDVQLRTRMRFWGLELFWNLTKKMSIETSKILTTKDCIKCLRDAFFDTLAQSNGKKIKELRNDFLLLFLTLIAYQNNCKKNILPPLFIKELSILATLPEVKQDYAIVENLKFEESWEDYEMKEFLLSILKLICGRAAYAAFLNPMNLIQSLLVHLRPLNLNVERKSLFISQKKTLQTLALQILSYYGPEFLSIFTDFQADVLIIRQIVWCFSNDILDHRRFIYERDIYLRFCLQILVNIIGLRNQEVIKSLINLNTVDHMLKIVNDTSDMPYEAPYVDNVVKIQTMAYLILAWLCDPGGGPAIVSIGAEGEDIIIKYLKILNTKAHIALPGHNMLLTAVLNCVRWSIIGIPVMEKLFKNKNGVSYLIDLLLPSHSSIQDLILGCLTDLCSNADSTPYILKWRGPNNMTVPMLLCRLWRVEEERMGIKRDETESSRNLHLASKQYVGTGKLLVGKLQSELTGDPMPSYRMSAAILIVSENFRAKIYGLIEYLKNEGSEVEPPWEMAKLPLEEMATLALIEGYFDLKGGEVWTEILDELTAEGMEPLSLEQEFIYSISRVITSRVTSIIGFQRQCKHLLQDKEKRETINYYQQFYDWKSQEKLLVIKTHQYLAKTSSVQTMRLMKEKDMFELTLEQHKTMIKKLEALKPERDVKLFNLRY